MIYTVTLNPSLDYVVRGDSFEKGKTNRSNAEAIYPGGKGINVSIVLNQLGIESQTMGFVAGYTGDILLHLLEESNIKGRFVRCSNGFTRINIKIKEIDAETEINGNGPDVNADEIGDFFALLDELTCADVLILSGSVPPSLPDNIYLQMLEHIGERGTKAVVDTYGDQLINSLKAKPYLVKPNIDELEKMLGSVMENEDDIISGAKRLQELGARNVIVSRGEKGAILVDENDSVHIIKCPPGELVNSVGAGDSMVAGFVAGMIQSGEYSTAIRLGIAAGCATAYSDWLATGDMIRNLLDNID